MGMERECQPHDSLADGYANQPDENVQVCRELAQLLRTVEIHDECCGAQSGPRQADLQGLECSGGAHVCQLGQPGQPRKAHHASHAHHAKAAHFVLGPSAHQETGDVVKWNDGDEVDDEPAAEVVRPDLSRVCDHCQAAVVEREPEKLQARPAGASAQPLALKDGGRKRGELGSVTARAVFSQKTE